MAPALTAILLMPRSFARLAVSVSHLRRQSIKSKIEVILVHAAGATADLDDELFREFHSFQRFESEGDFSVAEGFALAFRHGTAPVVAYIEDHVAINPQWAEAIVEAHRGPAAAVAPAMENGNHANSVVGRMNFLMGFVEWYGPAQQEEVSSGPGHNTTYKRAVLEPLGDRLADFYQSERNLCYHLEAQGHTMIVQPEAVTRHVNISRFPHAMVHSYCGGKIFGAQRAAAMTVLERSARTILSPLVPFIRLARITRTLVQRGKIGEAGYVSVLPCLLLGLSAHAAGEVAGYWRNAKRAELTYRQFELNRLSCVNAADRALLLAPVG